VAGSVLGRAKEALIRAFSEGESLDFDMVIEDIYRKVNEHV